MKAVRIHGYGGPEVLVYEDAPTPKPGKGEVLIEVHAAGVNPLDWKVREGFAKGWLNHNLPLILGWDVSGVVVETGEAAEGFKVGDEVYGLLDASRDGSYAEYVVAGTGNISLKPKIIDHVHAAAVPVAALTAWQSLFNIANLSPGQSVLIHGAAGGVGHFAVQFARWKGARIIATASPNNEEFLKRLGVERVIDYNTARFEEELSGLDCVLDTRGGAVLNRSLRVLKKGGIVVSTLGEPPAEELARYEVRAAGVMGKADPGQLTEIASLIDAGYVTPVVETVFPLEDAKKAHEMSKDGHVRGKIALKVRGTAVTAL